MRYTLTALSLLLLAGNVLAQEGYSAKSLFFAENDSVVTAPTDGKALLAKNQGKTDPAAKLAVTAVSGKKSPAPKHIGASYFIRLKNKDGTTRDVLASRKFKSGERFQLGVKVNRPTYVYILNEEAGGKVTQIYPPQGHNNFVNAMGTVFLPSKGSFEFDENTGTEHLLIYMSSTPMQGNMAEKIRTASPDMVSAPVGYTSSVVTACAEVPTVIGSISQESKDRIDVASVEPGYASKGIAFKSEAVAPCGGSAAADSTSGYSSKGIKFSEDSEPVGGGQTAAYVVKTLAKSDTSLYLKLKLVHE